MQEMTITIQGHSFRVELERLCRLFYPDERIGFIEPDGERDALHASVTLIKNEAGGEILAELQYCDGGAKQATSSRRELSGDSDAESTNLLLADALYELLVKRTGYRPPWGMLTGVRPVKLLRMLLEQGDEQSAKTLFSQGFHCSDDKYALCRETMRHEEPIIASSKERSFSLYISIPFCPTRCSYCSFVSQSIEQAGKLLPKYVELLKVELEQTALLAQSLGLRLETVYMGGGTPTTLSAEQLGEVLSRVRECFDTTALREFTVEAGRPDTVTRDKLCAIKNAGAKRISINPQTLDDEVLKAIGRRHTAAQVYEAMEIARSCGFDDINMDLIAGLPGDTELTFAKTLDRVLSMDPENITVHTLSMKRASTMVTSQKASSDAVGSSAGNMLELCAKRLPKAGYHPYYLYRQTRMVGNLENVGWSKPGHDGLYNVYIMDETHTILAVGAGGVTKMRQPKVNNIERIYNYKFPYEYIRDFDTVLERKKEVLRFYEKFC